MALLFVGMLIGCSPNISGVRITGAPEDAGDVDPDDAGSSDASATDATSDGSVRVDVFADAGTYEAGSPWDGAPANNADPSHGGIVEGKDCSLSSCHQPGTNPRHFFSGTIFSSKMNGSTVAGAEVRLVASDGTTRVTYSDENGNFWFVAPITDQFPAGASVGVRTASASVTRVNVPSGSCNASGGCHGNPANRIHVP